MRRVRVEVTAEDIAEARREHAEELACRCPIARALHRLGEHPDVGVYQELGNYNGEFVIGRQPLESGPKLPPEANSFVVAFDSREDVQPFSFEVELP